MAPKFIFMRHGEAEHNVAFYEHGESVFQDSKYTDPCLTPKGVEQAREAGKALSQFKIVDIWTSPLSRCIQTTEEVFEETNPSKLILHDNLLEQLGGGCVCNERKSKTELKQLYPHLDMSYLPTLPQYWCEKENSYAVHQRMFMLIMLLADVYSECSKNDYILLVSHANAINSITGKCLKNAEYVIMTLDEINKS